MSGVFIVGDVHGHLETLLGILRRAGLIAPDRSWTGGASTLWLMGDLVDHGPDGVGTVVLVKDLQRQASEAGGRVDVLLGNHDVVLLAAHRLGRRRRPGKEQTFLAHWAENGGIASDLQRLSPAHVAWLAARPAMAQVGHHLLVHADALFYSRYGGGIAAVNAAIAALLEGDDGTEWSRLIDDFGEHRAFVEPEHGTANAVAFLGRFGGRQIVHGHTPISKLTGQPPETVREPFLYAGSRCLDVDPGIYLGGPGFIYHLPGGEGGEGGKENG